MRFCNSLWCGSCKIVFDSSFQRFSVLPIAWERELVNVFSRGCPIFWKLLDRSTTRDVLFFACNHVFTKTRPILHEAPSFALHRFHHWCSDISSSFRYLFLGTLEHIHDRTSSQETKLANVLSNMSCITGVRRCVYENVPVFFCLWDGLTARKVAQHNRQNLFYVVVSSDNPERIVLNNFCRCSAFRNVWHWITDDIRTYSVLEILSVLQIFDVLVSKGAALNFAVINLRRALSCEPKNDEDSVRQFHA